MLFLQCCFFPVCTDVLLPCGSCRGATCQQAAVSLPAHREVISPQVQSWAGEVMLLGAVFLNPFDSSEKKPQPLICGIVQTGDSRKQAGNLRKEVSSAEMLQDLAASRFPLLQASFWMLPPPPSAWSSSQTVTPHPGWWQQPAGCYLYLCTDLRFIKLLRNPERACEARSACTEERHCPKAGKGQRNHRATWPAMGRVTERKRRAGCAPLLGHLQSL